MRWREYFHDLEKRQIALVIFTGLVVAWVRHGLQHHHWKGWDSWEDFFVAWFVHTMGVGMLMVASIAAIICTHKFFRGYNKDNYHEITFYVLMTILIGALGIAFIALRGPSDDYDDTSTIVIFAA